MSSRTLVWIAAGALLLAGCGGKDAPPTSQKDYEKYFGKKHRVASDRSIRLAANVEATSYAAGGEVGLNLMMSNMTEEARTLPIGLQSGDILAFTYMEALIRRDDGPIQHVDFKAEDGGDLFTADFGRYETKRFELFVSDYYAFDEPGKYRVVLFYTVKDGALPDGSTPDWTGTVWTSPITIEVE